jgi:hypothetical protein
MPTQRTIYSTLEGVERRLVDEGIRPPAVVVIGGVVTIAVELAALAQDLGDWEDAGERRHDGPEHVPSPVPPLAKDN